LTSQLTFNLPPHLMCLGLKVEAAYKTGVNDIEFILSMVAPRVSRRNPNRYRTIQPPIVSFKNHPRHNPEQAVPMVGAAGAVPAPGVWTFFIVLAQARLSRRLEPVVGDPSPPGSHRCRGRNRDRDRFRRCIVVGPHARCSLVTLVSSSPLLSFDSDSDSDPDARL
jgi:hypothetical protein